MKNIKQILALFILLTISSFAQEKGIYLVNKTTNNSVFIKENLRTKVVTIDRYVIVGKLKIIDDKTINVDGIDIPIETIFKIRRASLFHAIADPIAIVVGPALIGISLLAVGFTPNIEPAFAVLAMVPSLVITVLPYYKKDNHINVYWEYRIKN